MASLFSSKFGQTKAYEPSPRYGHYAAPVGGRCLLWGGCVPDFSASGRKKLASTVEIFDPYLEVWEQQATSGDSSPGLYLGACASLLGQLYSFGGTDGASYYNSLHTLDPTSLEWKELRVLNQADGPIGRWDVEWFPTMETDWHCLEAMAFPQAPLHLEQPLPRIPSALKGVGGATSSTSSTLMKVCNQFLLCYWMVYTHVTRMRYIYEYRWPPFILDCLFNFIPAHAVCMLGCAVHI